MRRYVVTLRETPPSLNATMYANRFAVAAVKRRLQADIETLLLAARVPRPIGGPVVATAELQFPTVRGRDEGNYRSLLEKVTGDALVRGGWLPDDQPQRFRFGAVEFSRAPGPARTWIALAVLEVIEGAA